MKKALVLIVSMLMIVAMATIVYAQSGADGNYVCDDFDTPNATAEAIAEGLADPSDLDADDDKTACEGTPGEFFYGDDALCEECGIPSDDPSTPTPSRIETGGGYCALNDC